MHKVPPPADPPVKPSLPRGPYRYLHKNHRNRYEACGYEFTCGKRIEAMIYDECEEAYEWIITRLEHNQNDYFLVSHQEIPLEGLLVRFRSEYF